MHDCKLWIRLFRVISPALLMLAVFSASPAFAALRVVTNTNDSGAGSLRQAIIDADASNTDDTIEFASDVTGTITLTSGVLEIDHSLSITGPGASSLAISGGGNSAVFSIFGGKVSISGLTVEAGNAGGDSGGGIANDGALTLTNCAVFDNFAGGDGGGIENIAVLTLINSTVSLNAAFQSGAGILNGGNGTLTLTNSTVSDNTAFQSGGGISNEATLMLTGSTVSGNTAVNGGGGTFNQNGATMTLSNSTVSGNTAMDGGGILNGGVLHDAVLTVTNSTLSGNTGTHSGGGIDNEGALTMTNSTFADNSAGTGGGIIGEGGSVTLKNTIVASSPSGGNCVSSATFTSNGHNLSDDTTCSSFLNGVGDLNDTPAGLDPDGLKDNGGPTETIALLAASNSVDAVPLNPTDYCTANDGTTPVATDQRGVPRSQGSACDIGAFELVSSVAGKLKVSPKTLKFGTVNVNQPKIKMVKVANAGKIKKKNQPLPILIEMESTNGTPMPSPFSVTTQCSEDDLRPKGKGVPASKTSCEVAVQFAPTQAVSYSGTLTIFDNLEPGGMQTVQMTGKGRAAK